MRPMPEPVTNKTKDTKPDARKEYLVDRENPSSCTRLLHVFRVASHCRSAIAREANGSDNSASLCTALNFRFACYAQGEKIQLGTSMLESRPQFDLLSVPVMTPAYEVPVVLAE